MADFTDTFAVANTLVDLTVGDAVPCDHYLDRTRARSCLAVLDKEIHYGTPQVAPKVIGQLCTGCRAHYYAQMTRNALIDHRRSR